MDKWFVFINLTGSTILPKSPFLCFQQPDRFVRNTFKFVFASCFCPPLAPLQRPISNTLPGL